MAETTLVPVSASTTTLSWRVHLAKEQPRRAVIATVAILFTVSTIGAITQNLFGTLFAAVLLFGSLNDFFLPILYELNERGVEARGLFSQTRLEWSRARRFYVLVDGVKVSPLAAPSRLEAYRGVFLRCSGETRDRVVAIIQDRLTTPATQPPFDSAQGEPNHPATFSGDIA